MQHAVFIAPFGDLADGARLVELAQAAEESGWDGLFLWDHVLRRDNRDIVDPWVVMGAMAAATTRLRFGPMVTPTARRRLVKLAREVMAVESLGAGRLILGLGLGVDTSGELSRLGDEVDAVIRGAMLDEAVPVLRSLLDGERVEHVGEYVSVDGVELGPSANPSTRPPFWFAARGDARRPVRRAARYEGVFPIEMSADRYGRLLDTIIDERGTLDGFDIAVRVEPGEPLPSYTADTATWRVESWPEVVDPDALLNSVVAGPPD